MKILKEFKIITKHYNNLVDIASQHYFVGIINEWIVDNYYLLVEQYDQIKYFLKKDKRAKYASKNGVLYKVIEDILERHNFRIDDNILIDELKKYEKEQNHYFSYQELAIVKMIISILLLNRISKICLEESNFILLKKEINQKLEQMKEEFKNKKNVSLKDYNLIRYDTPDREIVYFNDQLKELGKNAPKIFKEMNNILKDNNRNLNKVINAEHLDDANKHILVTNIFDTLNKLDTIKEEKLFDQLSKVEEFLKKDKTYLNMVAESKAQYRKLIIKKAKKAHLDPDDYVKELLRKKEHVGFSLFNNQTKEQSVLFYIIAITFFTVTLSYILADYFIPNRIIGTILLLIPVSEIVIFVLNQFLMKFKKDEALLKMDYSKGIPSNSKTMVVVPTIVKNKEKVNSVFENLEKYYLSNKSNNIYFTLLGDCMEYSKENYEKDSEIIKAGQTKVQELNKKYGRDIFYFVYRKRKYNSFEGTYLGWERKRGALLQFNDLLLGNLSDKEKQEYFNIQTFDHFNHKIKYVITLDVDTQLVLNSAFLLVGTMDHPLNRPVYNNNQTKIIKGYGILQPNISIDIASTNKSLFSQVYAGIGGFDPYSNTTPNFYQDVFKEGSFVGKGIYDLEVCQHLLKGTFPNNRILSHDLLEGNYLRCGCVTDVELVDDFPSKFSADAVRRARWARGDIQIINWITPTVKNTQGEKVKNPISLLGKWKIFDNIRRGLIEVSLLFILLLVIFVSKVDPIWWFLFVLSVILLPVIAYILKQINFNRNESVSVKYYNVLVFGFKALVIKTLALLTTIPFNAYLYMNSFIRSIYRMTISKKNLLNWITAEDAEKNANSSFIGTLKSFWMNYLVIAFIILSTIAFDSNFMFASVIVIIFLTGPIFAYLISQDIKSNLDFVTKNERKELETLGYETWKFFEDHLNAENNYLIPDNYQTNRQQKQDIKTSPTNIGFSLLAVISAYEFEWIEKDRAIQLLNNIIDTVDSLPKWNGHLYNWYNIKTKEIMLPSFISTVDSGNFVASLIVLKEFLYNNKQLELGIKVEKLINQTSFKPLYNKDDVFSVGYNVDEGIITPFNYNKFASESRIVSFVAIAKGDVPSKHWFNLDKTLTTYKNRKGLISWSGTFFEYYMPLIFMKSYPNTLIDESYDFAFHTQRQYIREINTNLPWGISESAYNELDDAQNYKYKAFGVPHLRLREEPRERLVISPYSSLLVLPKFPKETINNIKKLQKLGMEGKYGFYEAYDADDKIPVFAYFAHHQGMILASITNYLKDNLIQNYFSGDIHNQAFEILNKEKVQIKPMINMEIMEYKKYAYDKEPFVNDIRVFNHLSILPEVSVLSNSKYTVLINDRGNGFSRYRTIQLNRYRKITEQDYGMFVYIKDLKSNFVWSNTYAPMNIKPDKYEVVFALDRIKFIRQDRDIMTTTEIVVTKTYNAEIRKITFKNLSEEVKKLELTTYAETILCQNVDDISHKVFNDMFIDSEYDSDTNSIIMHRKLRDSNNHYYMINRLLIEKPECSFQYETNRMNFIGRNHSIQNPIAIDKKLSSTTGIVLDPIISLRNTIIIDPEKEVTVYFVSGFGKSREQVLDIVNTYNNEAVIQEKAFEVATIMSNVTTKMVNITGNDMRLYNTMLNYLYQTSRLNINESRQELLKENNLSQENLWKFGISGDYPMILLDVKDVSDINLIKELLHAFEYYKSRSVFIDLVILNVDDSSLSNVIAKEIDEEKYHMYAINSFNKTPGNIYIIDRNDITPEETKLLYTVSRLSIDSSEYISLENYVESLQKQNRISVSVKANTKDSLPISYKKEDLTFFNEYGGFTNDGKEYLVVRKDTPVAWSNVIANPHFGTIITNNNCGFTFAKNSREYKITAWTNDVLLNDQSEGIKFNDVSINFDLIKNGFGYSEMYGETKNLEISLVNFVGKEDPVKFTQVKLKNKLNSKVRIELKYWMNPTLGSFEDKTSRYIACDFDKSNNMVTLQNRYDKYFNNQKVFITSTEPIKEAILDKVLTKEIVIEVFLNGKEEKDLSFILGAIETENLLTLKDKYHLNNQVETEKKNVINNWKEKLGKIQIETIDDSFNYMMNGWLLYQALVSRIYAKAGFYQVSGAYGYRDQLQDSMNIVTIEPELTKNQILKNAAHQFKEGDVMHWWHEETNIGLRSLYKDDYLWLIYATNEYVMVTGDEDILREEVPFVEGPILTNDKELGMPINFSNDKATLYEHCKRAIDKSLNELGSNGLPLMGGGDWNDGMNLIGVNGQGTSVWLGFFLIMMLDKFIELTKIMDPGLDINRYEQAKVDLKESLRNIAWDKDYYLRAFFDNGNKLGSYENQEGKIDLISQCFAILSETATTGQIKKILRSVDEQLVDKNLNIVKLITPPFKDSVDNPGYIMDYPSGIRENGGQYTHAVAWYIMALLKVKKFDEAYDIYQMINPINRTLTKEDVEKYQVEPYVISADIYSNKYFPSKGGWTWYTGSAAWFYRVGLIDIIGFHKRGNKLYIEPNVPSKWKNYKIKYQYGNTIYDIKVINNSKKEQIIIDGTIKSSKYIPLKDDEQKHKVEVYIVNENDN